MKCVWIQLWRSWVFRRPFTQDKMLFKYRWPIVWLFCDAFKFFIIIAQASDQWTQANHHDKKVCTPKNNQRWIIHLIISFFNLLLNYTLILHILNLCMLCKMHQTNLWKLHIIMHVNEIKNISSLRTIGLYKVAHYSVSDTYKKITRFLVQFKSVTYEKKTSIQCNQRLPCRLK